MKKLLIAAFVIGFATLTHAQAQTARGTFTAPSAADQRRDQIEQRRVPPPRTPPREVGAIPRATRGNPIQMINPRAPQRYYAHPDETIVHDPQNPNRPVGFILFGLRW
jgi:hypothetical protein